MPSLISRWCPCEACRELEQDAFIPRVLVSLHKQLNYVETGDKFVKNKKSKRELAYLPLYIVKAH
jgi:hypothetical protein